MSRMAGKRTVAAALACAVILAAAGAAAHEEAAVLYACAREDGVMRMLTEGTACRRGETLHTWNAQGPTGPAGPQGPAGATEVTVRLTAPDQAPTSAAGFLKLGDIKGEVTDDRHKDWIEILSFSHGISAAPTSGGAGGGAATGKASFSDLTITKRIDKSTPLLMQVIAGGTHIPTAELNLARRSGDGSVIYMRYELKNVIISAYSVSGGGGERPTEQLSLNFAEIKVTYTSTDATGKPGEQAEFSWNLKENKGL